MASTSTQYISPTRKRVAKSTTTTANQYGQIQKKTFYEAAVSTFQPFYGWLTRKGSSQKTLQARRTLTSKSSRSTQNKAKMFQQPLVQGIHTSKTNASSNTNSSSSSSSTSSIILSAIKKFTPI